MCDSHEIKQQQDKFDVRQYLQSLKDEEDITDSGTMEFVNESWDVWGRNGEEKKNK